MHWVKCIKPTNIYKFLKCSSLQPAITCTKSYSVNQNDFQHVLELQNSNHHELKHLIEAYQTYGHFCGNINPLITPKTISRSELLPEYYGLSLEDKVSSKDDCSVSDLIASLQSLYCGKITLEAAMILNSEEKSWLHQQFCDVVAKPISIETKLKICKILVESQTLDNFLGTKFATLKRYSCEGAESMLVFIDQCLQAFSSNNLREVVIGMPHRGRNNCLIGLLKFPLETMLRKIKGLSEFPKDAEAYASGDVLSHLSISTDIPIDNNKSLHVNVLPNSSFLESVNAVAMGKCRGRQDSLSKEEVCDRDSAACLLLHGDAAFTGQGVVMECLNMTDHPNFNVGGTVHLIVNNQLGFTTPSNLGRSSYYASDIGKMINCPVIHVNGDDPELVLKAAEVAVEYQRKFKRDIIVDLLCYRRWGHNEMDDPSFTQPLMYKTIENQMPVSEIYSNQLRNEGILSDDTVEEWKTSLLKVCTDAHKVCDQVEPPPTYFSKTSSWKDMTFPSNTSKTTWNTGCSAEELLFVGAKSVEVPQNFTIHSNVKKNHVDGRMKKLTTTNSIDWALAEAFAFGTLLHQGFDVRLSGQDVGRGTFSHRHLAITCQDSENIHYPLNHLYEKQTGQIEIVPSHLSEEAVLGFEYGVSIENPNRLVVWEAQFGDFFTGAQVPIDTLIYSGEAKWMCQSGIVILLPHGYDGAGPEHSSARIERFLQCTDSSENEMDCDNVNVSVCHPTTAAQYFHLLRRQMVRNFRKPLIVASPKTLLRLPAACSPVKDFTEETYFNPVLADPLVQDLSRAEKIILCSGKHYYALHQHKQKLGSNPDQVAIIRIEELCPFPAAQLQLLLSAAKSDVPLVWAQEEPRNMGPWSFVEARFRNILGKQLVYAGRPPLSAPAVGIGIVHQQQSEQIISDAFA